MAWIAFAVFITALLTLTGCVSWKAALQEHQPAGDEYLTADEYPLGTRSLTSAADISMRPREPDVHSSLRLDLEVAPWYRFHQAALSFTFDDGTLDQYLIVYPELERRNLKATFFLLSGFMDDGIWPDFERSRRLMNWDQAREMAEKGHEIGSHGHTHTELLEGDAIEEELRLSQAVIEREIPIQQCISLSWPFWRSSSTGRKLAEKYYAAARAGGADPERYLTKNGGVPSPNPESLFEVGSMGILAEKAYLWGDAGDAALEAGSWIVLCLHGVDDGTIEKDALGWQAVPLSSFQDLLDHVQAQDLWIAPFGNVARYIRERQSVELKILEKTEKRLVLLLTDGLDDEIFDHPLSLRIKMREPWEAVRVLQGSRLIPSVVQSDGWLLFDATPDRGLITIITKNRAEQPS